MAAIGITRRVCMAAVVVAAAFGGPAARGVDVWMPQTGEVDLDSLPRRTPEERFNHAAALIGAGQAVSGIRQMEKLLKQAPDFPFVEQGHYLIAYGLFSAGHYRKAFEKWGAFRARYPGGPLNRDALEMQLHAAGLESATSLNGGVRLFDSLIGAAPSVEFAARCHKEKADAILAAGDFLRARSEYVALVDTYPDSVWVPYCWFKVAECRLAMARRVRRGTQYLNDTHRALRDYVATFPRDKHVPEAQDLLKDVQQERAATYRRIAEHYLDTAKRPTAAVPYLDYLIASFPDTPEAQWARDMTERIRAQRSTPLPGEMTEIDLPGVRIKSGQDAAGADAAGPPPETQSD